jgi:peptidyl-prolyl cis-trans isomerase SurA
MRIIKNTLTILLLAVCGAASAQGNGYKVVADKIAAVIGDRIVLESDIKNAVSDMVRRGEEVPQNAACLLMDQAIISKVLMLQAEKDSLPVTDEEVEADLDNRIRQYINQVGSQQALEEMAGKTIYQIKDDARESVKEQKLAASMQRKIVENVRITPQEVKAFYERIPKDSLPFYETEVEVGQIVIYPKASREVELYILGEMNKYKQQLEAKKVSFCELAKSKSEDPGSKDRCGQYQINRTEKSWDPVFLSTAFRLKEGELSAPVKSKFGYHIIQMMQRNGDEAVVQHILMMPPVTDDEIKLGKDKLDTVRSKLIAGTIGFNEAALKYSNDESVKFAGAFLTGRDGSTYVTLDQLDKDMVNVVGKMKTGEFSQPLAFEGEQGKKGVRIIYLKNKTEPHRMNINDDYSRISTFALEEKKSQALDKWLKEKLNAYYIMVDEGTAQECPALKKYVSDAKVL